MIWFIQCRPCNGANERSLTRVLTLGADDTRNRLKSDTCPGQTAALTGTHRSMMHVFRDPGGSEHPLQLQPFAA